MFERIFLIIKFNDETHAIKVSTYLSVNMDWTKHIK
jgi:hypothetical protein